MLCGAPLATIDGEGTAARWRPGSGADMLPRREIAGLYGIERMNRGFVACFMAGAFGGAVMSFLIVALLRVMVLDPQDQATGLDRMGARVDGLESRIQRLELNSGALDPHDAQRAGAPQRGALD